MRQEKCIWIQAYTGIYTTIDAHRASALLYFSSSSPLLPPFPLFSVCPPSVRSFVRTCFNAYVFCILTFGIGRLCLACVHSEFKEQQQQQQQQPYLYASLYHREPGLEQQQQETPANQSSIAIHSHIVSLKPIASKHAGM